MTAGVVLTGGASRRMGTDKAFVVVAGRPMAVAVADALWEGGCHPVDCQGGDLDRLATLGLTVHADSRPGDGPVAAIVDALERHGRTVVVAACDLPYLSADVVRAVRQTGGAASFAAVDGRPHLVSAWSGDTLPTLRGLLERGELSYRAALEAVGAVAVAVEPVALRNVNAPDDVEE